ncbi:MAG TPA: glutamate cyclase domain-containing protein [Gemmataceae bacterium]|nr:glutamate cyclase domain-containing protein [Gemmataceae bacterium]
MSELALARIRELIQEDIGKRGLRTDPAANLISACSEDFAAACQSLASTPDPGVAIITGFFIPHAQPPCSETDGPLGAIFLARALVPLGFRIALVTDGFCSRALEFGLKACSLEGKVPLFTLPPRADDWESWQDSFLSRFAFTHLLAVERVGPSHTPSSLKAQPGSTRQDMEQFEREVPTVHYDRCHTMRGLDITEQMAPAHLLLEGAARRHPGTITIGIGDGGNEIGMGKIPWQVIRRNIPNGGLVACRVPTDYLIVAGTSNWGAYGLAAGVRILRGALPDPELFDPDREREILRIMVESGPLVDGVLARPAVSVDGIPYERYGIILRQLAAIHS